MLPDDNKTAELMIKEFRRQLQRRLKKLCQQRAGVQIVFPPARRAAELKRPQEPSRLAALSLAREMRDALHLIGLGGKANSRPGAGRKKRTQKIALLHEGRGAVVGPTVNQPLSDAITEVSVRSDR